MSSRSRSLLLIFVAVLVLIAGGIYFLASNLNGIVAGIIREQGSAATGTSVAVEGVDIKLTEATASLSGLSVANPRGFSGDALGLGSFSVQLDPGSLTSDTIVIKSLVVDGASINVLQQGTQNNLKVLLDNLKSTQGSAPAPDNASASSKRLIVERFTLSGARASVSIPELNEEREVELPSIVVRDVGKATNGATAAEVAEQLLTPVLQAAMQSATAQAVKDRARDKVEKAVGGMLKGITGDGDD